MSRVIRIPEEIYKRLQALATPFVDTPASVIERLLDAYDGAGQTEFGEAEGDATRSISVLSTAPLSMDPDEPDDLKHTRILRATVEDVDVKRPNWNKLVGIVHEFAVNRMDLDQLLAISPVNVVQGRHNKSGFRYFPKADLSIQGVEANKAWQSVLELAQYLSMPLEIVFEWYDKEGAVHPGQQGRLSWAPED